MNSNDGNNNFKQDLPGWDSKFHLISLTLKPDISTNYHTVHTVHLHIRENILINTISFDLDFGWQDIAQIRIAKRKIFTSGRFWACNNLMLLELNAGHPVLLFVENF